MPSHRGQRASCCPVWHLSLQLTSWLGVSVADETKLKRVGATLGSNVYLGLSLTEDF